MVFCRVVLQTIGLMKEEVLAAVPLFIFMGYLLEEGGLMERLFHAHSRDADGPLAGVRGLRAWRHGLLPGCAPDHRTHEGGGPRRGAPVHLHGLSSGRGRAHGTTVP